MNILNPWNAIFFVAFVIYFTTRGIYASRTKNVERCHQRHQSVERMLLIGMVPGTLVLPLVYLFTSWLRFADYRLPVWALTLGVVCIALSLWFFWRSHADLGENWSVTLELRKDHALITHGVYSKIRHPMYASIWLWGIGQGLLLQNWLAGWSFIPAFTAMYFFRIPREEQLMLDQFPESYPEYVKRTGRIIPKFF